VTRGRKPLPTELKIAKGTQRKGRAKPAEPKPEVEAPTAPAHLAGPAREEWNRITVELVKLKLISQLDRAALAAYCTAYGRWIEAEAKVKELGTVVNDGAGKAVVNPHLTIADRALKQMHQFLTEFGLTPSSRTRVGAPKGSSNTGGVPKRSRA
jgi:P27 family predicted phage terminase small subunit